MAAHPTGSPCLPRWVHLHLVGTGHQPRYSFPSLWLLSPCLNLSAPPLSPPLLTCPAPGEADVFAQTPCFLPGQAVQEKGKAVPPRLPWSSLCNYYSASFPSQQCPVWVINCSKLGHMCIKYLAAQGQGLDHFLKLLNL